MLKIDLNSRDKLKRIPSQDYIFWLDKKIINELPFKLTMLKMKIAPVDTSGTKHRQLKDSIKIN